MAQAFARSIVESQEYIESVKRRIKNDTLAPAVENTLLHYAYGKPKDTLDLNVRQNEEPVSEMGAEQLAAEAAALGQQVLELKAAEETERLQQMPSASDEVM